MGVGIELADWRLKLQTTLPILSFGTGRRYSDLCSLKDRSSDSPCHHQNDLISPDASSGAL